MFADGTVWCVTRPSLGFFVVVIVGVVFAQHHFYSTDDAVFQLYEGLLCQMGCLSPNRKILYVYLLFKIACICYLS